MDKNTLLCSLRNALEDIYLSTQGLCKGNLEIWKLEHNRIRLFRFNVHFSTVTNLI